MFHTFSANEHTGCDRDSPGIRSYIGSQFHHRALARTARHLHLLHPLLCDRYASGDRLAHGVHERQASGKHLMLCLYFDLFHKHEYTLTHFDTYIPCAISNQNKRLPGKQKRSV